MKWERLYRTERDARRRDNLESQHRILELERQTGLAFWRSRLGHEPVRTWDQWLGHSVDFTSTPVLKVNDVRPRLLAKALRLDPSVVHRMAERPDDARRVLDDRMASDLARELVRQGFVRYEWAESRGEYEYRARHEPSTHYRTPVWSVLVSSVPIKGAT